LLRLEKLPSPAVPAERVIIEQRAVNRLCYIIKFCHFSIMRGMRIGKYLVYALAGACWLLTAVAPAASRVVQQRADFLQAEQALKQGDNAEFEQLMSGLTDYPLYPSLRYRSLRKQPLQRAAAVESFLRAYPDTPYALFLRKRLLTALASNKRWQEFVDHYQPGENTALECRFYQASYNLGHRREATAGARELWLAGTSQPDACDALFSIWQADGGLTPELVWRRFGLAMDNSNPGLAKYLKRYLSTNDSAAADFWLSVHNRPEQVLQCVPWRCGEPRHGRIFAHGVARLTRTHPIQAHTVWQARKSFFAIDHAAQARAEQRIGIALAKGRYRPASPFLAAIPPEHSSEAVRAWRVRSALMAADWTAAESALNRLTETEQAMPRWRYWRGKTLAELGRRQQAERVFRELAADRSFYGFLAADRLGLKYTAALTDRPAIIDVATMLRIEQSRPVRAAYEFLHFEREAAARGEWWHTLKSFDREELMAAAKIAQKWQWHQMAIFTIAKAEYWDDLTLRFPVLFRHAVVNNAMRHGMNPAVVFGLIRRESVFDPAARSPAGARGLMQIMPATGRYIAGKLYERWRSTARLNEPDVNIRYGTFYFSGLLNHFNGNFALAAAGYNAGPGRVKRWLPVDRPMPADLWVEMIPFKETRDYVTTVLMYAVIYQDRLGEPTLRLSDLIPDIVLLNPRKERGPDIDAQPVCTK
jgi:peptidoglycan lytic transglycosylase